MNKSELLNNTHQKFLKIGLCILPIEDLEEIVIEDYMGFGTTADERMFSLTDLRNLILRQKEQSAGIQISYDIKNIYNRLSSHELSAYFADDITVCIKMGNEDIQIQLRFSCMYEYMDNKWMAVHSHGSKPENVATEEDTWGIEEWKKKNLELETLVKERTAELEKSLNDLKSTQAQLIQSEKMASLGELTAGIAHEIQNPLNFVNNFSEVSNELIVEMTEELNKGDIEEAIAISADIKTNLEKINHHGKRASSIVKGMLEHSRKSSGTKEPTDINAFADEYLRLAYHGLRAKDKNFNATMETHLDPNLPKIEIIPQDIGRVLLNLITNAFYAVNEKTNLLNLAKQKGDANLKDFTYEPKVSVSTKRVDSPLGVGGERGKVEFIQISVSDNGSGIPAHIKDKIFQPFFTTKPTGQGTGLGLSLAYDIVKAHGGELIVETNSGKGLPTDDAGTEFRIILPFS